MKFFSIEVGGFMGIDLMYLTVLITDILTSDAKNMLKLYTQLTSGNYSFILL